MTTLTVSMSDELMAFVEAQSAAEGYSSPDEYLRSLVREARKRRARRTLEAKIQEALDSGPAEPMTREEWDSIEAEALERRRRRENAEK